MKWWEIIERRWYNLSQEEKQGVAKRIEIVAVVIVIFLFIASCLSSCKTTTPVLVTEHKETVRHDTVTQIDSIIIFKHIYTQADTIYNISEVIKYKIQHEKELVYKTDSIPYMVEVETIKEVKAPLNAWQRFIQISGYILWAALLLIIIGTIIKLIIKLKS